MTDFIGATPRPDHVALAAEKKEQTKPIVGIDQVRGRTDNANASRFVTANCEKLRYVVSWKLWLAWTGKKWCLKNGNDRAMKLARKYADRLWKSTSTAMANPTISDNEKKEILAFAKQSNDARRIENMVKLACHDDRTTIHHDELDTDPCLFNCVNGTLDLKSGTFRTHQREDLLTQVANVTYDTSAQCPLWTETLGYVFGGDDELIAYFQTLIGYALAGITDEHILPICYGSGNNGKSTVWNTLYELLGDYAALVGQDLLMPNNDKHPTEMADLFGKRFVAVSEPEQGRKIAESMVKQMTGDKVLKARRMREDFWEFQPTHTFWLSTNHRPRITGTDNGIWRRIKLIPFEVDLSDVVTVDKAFPEKLKAEYSGILNWALEGWKRYQSEGLREPKAVLDATDEYRGAEDIVGTFIRETYVENSAFFVKANDCFEAFKQAGGKLSQTEFGREMSNRYEKARQRIGGKPVTIYRGIGTLE